MRLVLSIFSLLIFLSCGDDSNSNQSKEQSASKEEKSSQQEVKCKYGQPVAIFSEKLAKIKKQSFEVNGQKGVETVEFEDGKYLELFQSGCNEIRQEYRFTIQGEHQDKPDAFWFAEAINHMSYIGQLDERYAVIGIWVGALERLSPEMTIGQFSEAEPSTFIMVDKIVESGSSLLLVVLEARTTE